MILCKIDVEENSECKKCCKYCNNKCEKRCVFDKRNVKCGAEDDKYKSIFDNLTNTEFEDILNKCEFKYRKVDKGKGGLYIDSNFEGK